MRVCHAGLDQLLLQISRGPDVGGGGGGGVRDLLLELLVELVEGGNLGFQGGRSLLVLSRGCLELIELGLGAGQFGLGKRGKQSYIINNRLLYATRISCDL